MGNTTKIALISAGSSIVTSAVVGFVCFVKGKQKGIAVAEAALMHGAQGSQEHQAGNQRQPRA